MDAGDVDPERPEFVGEVLGQGGDGHVAHAADSVARLARGEPADVDDPSPARRFHPWDNLARAAEVAQDLRVHFSREDVVGQVFDSRLRRGAARPRGVVDKDVDLPELGEHRFSHGAD